MRGMACINAQNDDDNIDDDKRLLHQTARAMLTIIIIAPFRYGDVFSLFDGLIGGDSRASLRIIRASHITQSL